MVAGPRLLEMAGLERVRVLLEAANAVPVLARKTKAIAAIQLLEFGNDERLSPMCLAQRGNRDGLPAY